MKQKMPVLAASFLALISLQWVTSEEPGEKRPEEKISTGIIQILPTSPAFVDPNHRTENFIANEIASLSMGEVLRSAAHEIDWGDQEMDPNLLKKSIKVSRIEGTDMAKISAASTGRISGKKIVEAIIQAYASDRQSQEIRLSRTRLKALDDEMIKQSDLIQDNRKELTVLIQQYGIPYFENQPNTLGELEHEAYTDARRKLNSIELELALIQAKQALAKSDKDLERKATELQLQKNQLQERVDSLQAEAIDLSIKQSQYNQAIEAYKGSQALFKKMKQRQQEARVALHIPSTPMIVRQKPE